MLKRVMMPFWVFAPCTCGLRCDVSEELAASVLMVERNCESVEIIQAGCPSDSGEWQEAAPLTARISQNGVNIAVKRLQDLQSVKLQIVKSYFLFN
jgi:hypothetical protein